MAQTVKVLNSVAALGADATISGGNLQVVGITIPLRNIRPSSSVTAYAAGTAQVNTATPTAANSTFFAYTIQGLSTIDGRIKLWTATYTTAASGDTATTICNALRAKFAQFYDLPYTIGGTATLTITGIIASSNNNFTSLQDSTSVGTIATALTTPAVSGVGAGTLIANGQVLPISTDTQIVTTNNYTTVSITYIDPKAIDTRNTVHESLNTLVLYVNQGDADYPTLVGTYGVLTQAIKGIVATHVTATGTMAVTQATGALELASSGTFMVDAAIQPGDIAYPATFVYYPVISMSDTNSGLTNNLTPGNLSAAAFTWVTLRQNV